MMMTKIKRVLKAGFVNFWRNGWVSLATILIMVITLFTMVSLVFARAVLLSTLDELQNKVDISVYFKTDANEPDILSLKDALAELSEVKGVEYISREQALKNFKERHKDNALITQSLDELGSNPLGAAINIKAKDTSQYAGIAKYLEDRRASEGVSSIIDKVNYRQNKLVIERLSRIMDSSKRLGFGVSIILLIISVLVTFNTIRLAIYTAREEINVMKLVGASNRFISGPFVVEGFMYGIIAGLATMVLFYPVTMWLGPITEGFFGGINLYSYYLSNFVQIFLLLIFTGVILGAFSSMIAIRRYLRV
ncbi:MAG: ABC transporter permease [bacterium]|nr:ABC transporter permease [bacterium]